MFKVICRQAGRLLLILSVCAVIYTGVSTMLVQILFPIQAQGRLIMKSNQLVGSALIGQATTNPTLFIGRPTVVSNLSAVSAAEKQAVAKRVTWWHQLDPYNQQAVPVDLVTGSAGGTDPYISLAGANYQRQRVAHANHLSLATVNQLITAQTTSVFANWFGERCHFEHCAPAAGRANQVN